MNQSKPRAIWLGNSAFLNLIAPLETHSSLSTFRVCLNELSNSPGDFETSTDVNPDEVSATSVDNHKLLALFQAASVLFRGPAFSEVLAESDVAFSLGRLRPSQSLSVLMPQESNLFAESLFDLLKDGTTWPFDAIRDFIERLTSGGEQFDALRQSLDTIYAKHLSSVGETQSLLLDEPVVLAGAASSHHDRPRLVRYELRVKEAQKTGLNESEVHFAQVLPDLLIAFSKEQEFPAAVPNDPLELLGSLFHSWFKTTPEKIRSLRQKLRRTRLRPLLLFLLSNTDDELQSSKLTAPRKLVQLGTMSLEGTGVTSSSQPQRVGVSNQLPMIGWSQESLGWLHGSGGALFERRLVHTQDPSEFCFRFI